MWLILGFLGFFALMDISIELTKVRKLLERQEAARLADRSPK
jgi:hypothetical protein